MNDLPALAEPIRITRNPQEFELYRIILDWECLHEAFRDRVEDLEVTRTEVDTLGKLQPGYSAKILCNPPIRSFGPKSLEGMMKATGTALVLVVDDERFAPVKERLTKRRRPQRSIVHRPRPTWLFTREKARKISTNRWKDIPSELRKKMMKKAQKASGKARRAKARAKRRQAERVSA